MKVYIINLIERIDRRESIIRVFKKYKEFELIIVDAIKSDLGSQGLFQSFKKIVSNAVGSDYVIICEDDHYFTDDFDIEKFKIILKETNELQADILLGGPSYFQDGFFISEDLLCITTFTGLQFTVIFKRFYERILSYDLPIGQCFDIMIGSLSNKVFAIYPPISFQKSFGYSDVTLKNNNISVEEYFVDSRLHMDKIFKVSKYFGFL